MKFLRFLLLAVASLIVSVQSLIAQENPLAYLQSQCPRLTDMYQEELANCHAHYIFAVDVSLSMARFEETVLPSLQAFIAALPNGDRVTLIPFAHDAERASEMGFDVLIDAASRRSMQQMLSTLYPHGDARRDKQYYDTDIYLAQQAVAKSLQMNSQYEVNIVVFISDLLHCPKDNKDRQFSSSEMGDMKTLLKSAINADADTRVFALELPPSGNIQGFVQPALVELYAENGIKFKSQKVPADSQAMIGQWFAKLKNEIMFNKLQSVIFAENKANPIVVTTEVDIDGNVKAHVEWTAGKLYPKLTLDSTYISNPAWNFKANPDYVHYSVAGNINEDIELGQIKHQSFGFHQLADTLHFDVKLPVEYQSEIDRLLEGEPGPLANATEYKSRLVWTFFLPLWLTVTLLVLFILYVILVIKAMIRNAKFAFNGKMTLSTDREKLLREERLNNIAPSATLSFGSKGSPAKCAVDGVDWCFVIEKKKSNPFLIFSKPKFVWRKTSGFVAKGKAQSGDVGSTLKVMCGSDRDHVTHSVKVQFFNNK